MLLGAILVFAGLTLAITPVSAARAANRLRFVPYSNSGATVRYYRASGVASVAIGIVVAFLLH